MSELISVGVDEVGRGALAGPVMVGICVSSPAAIDSVLAESKIQKLPLRDSKKLSEIQREKWKAIIDTGMRSKIVRYVVTRIEASEIDRIGINPSIARAIAMGLERVCTNPQHYSVFLDGGLSAPLEYIHQQTIIRGDEEFPIISFASIVAKQIRDRYMREVVAVEHPEYGFESNVGYGSQKHRDALIVNGPCSVHRISYLESLTSFF